MSGKKTIIQALILAGLLVSIFFNHRLSHKLKNIPRESYIDTIEVEKPVPRDSLVIRYETRYLPIAKPAKPSERDTLVVKDTTVIHDSVYVAIPITQKHYQKEQYEAWVSGFEPKLDSLRIYAPTNVVKVPQVKNRWVETTVGLHGGVSYANGKPFSYIGIGVQIGVPVQKFFEK